MSENYGEPWMVSADTPYGDVGGVYSADLEMVAQTMEQKGHSARAGAQVVIRNKLARRIVACVNHCKGIETEILETDLNAPKSITMSGERWLRALRERDEARAMVGELRAMVENHGVHAHDCNTLRQDWNGGIKGYCTCGRHDLLTRAQALLTPAETGKEER